MNTTSILKSYIYVRLLCYYCTHLRDIKRIVDDHLNTRVYQYIFLVFFFVLSISIISQHAISMSLYPISKGSCNSIVFETLKFICVVLFTYCKFSFLPKNQCLSYLFVITFYAYNFSDYFNSLKKNYGSLSLSLYIYILLK